MGKDLSKVAHTFLFCDGSSCQKAGGELAVRSARAYLRNQGLWNQTHTIKTRCNGRCEDAPTCIVQSGDYWYKNINPKNITEIVKSHIDHNKPVSEYLLFNPIERKMYSDHERKAIVPNPFELKQDDALGWVYITKGFSSDQYLYPLFRHLLEHDIKGTLKLNNGVSYGLKELTEVQYNTQYTAHLSFGAEVENFVIGALPKNIDEQVVEAKITQTFYYINKDNQQKGVLFKNKKGRFVAELKIDAEEQDFLDYCLKIQLLGLKNPIV